MKKIHTLPLLATVGSLLLSLGCLKAADYTVTMGPGFSLIFTPASIAINQGDTVTWTNASATSHTTTSGTIAGFTQVPDGLWGSGLMTPNASFSITFNNFATNTYPYYCQVHGSAMLGTLTVTNAAPQPQPTLTSPALATGQFHFSIQGLIGQKYAIQSSPDLISWTSINTNLATSTSASVTDPSASNAPVNFYRVLEIQ